MAGGTFVAQNKVRPGAYINFNTEYKAIGTISERGRVLLPLHLSFGPVGSGVEVDRDSDVKKLFGLDSGCEELTLLREAAKKAKTVVVWRLNDGEKAAAQNGSFCVTAKHSGSLGNKIAVQVTAAEQGLLVSSSVDGVVVEEQTVAAGAVPNGNDLVNFAGAAAAGSLVLQGGSDGEDDWEAFFRAARTLDFDTVAIPSEDAAVKEQALSFVRSMREDEGRKIQAVVAEMEADYEGVISVKNGVILTDGRELEPFAVTAYAAGMTAGSEVNQSNTYAYYEGAVDVTERFTNSEIERLLQAGQMVFLPKGGKVLLEADINSFVSVSGEKGKAFCKNRVLRVLDSIGNDVKEIFEAGYIGKVHNNADGQRLLQAEILHYLQSLEQLGAVANVKAEDILIGVGDSADSVVVELLVQPVDSMEKLYMTVTAE